LAKIKVKSKDPHENLILKAVDKPYSDYKPKFEKPQPMARKNKQNPKRDTFGKKVPSKPKGPRKISYKGLMRKADTIFSKYIRQRDYKGLMRKADTIFSKYIRQRDSIGYNETLGSNFNKCCTCGRIKENTGGMIHAGHFQKRANMATRYDEQNVNAQCKKCNSFEGGRDFEYGMFIDEKYGPGTAVKLYNKANARIKVRFDRTQLWHCCKTV